MKKITLTSIFCLSLLFGCVQTPHGSSTSSFSSAESSDSSARPHTESIRVAALMYHYFNTDEDIKNHAYDGIYPQEFESDLDYFKKHGYRTITCSELYSYQLGEIDLPDKCILLTIDDGHYSVFEHVFPLLPKYEACVNLSIIGDYSTNIAPMRNHQSPRINWMNWDEIKAISQSKYVEIGSHSYYFHDRDHGRYGVKKNNNESDAEYKNALDEDLLLNSAYIKKYCDYDPCFFAYPFSAVQFDYIDYMLSNYSFNVLLAGNSKRISETCANVFSYGKGKEGGSIMRRFSRYTGDNIEELLNSIFENLDNEYTERGLG